VVALNTIAVGSKDSRGEYDLEKIKSSSKKRSVRRVGEIDGYPVYRGCDETGDDWSWYVLDPVGDWCHVRVTGSFAYGNRILKVSSLYASRGGRVRAHRLYRYLLESGQVDGLAGVSHSPGALRVWKRLAALPGVFVYGWHPDGPVPINRVAIGVSHSKKTNKISATVLVASVRAKNRHAD
jgi:hypothetical protein